MKKPLLLVGPEIGGMYKEDIHDIILTSYMGATLGLQFNFNVGLDFAF